MVGSKEVLSIYETYNCLFPFKIYMLCEHLMIGKKTK